jgi:hypothetical protein
MNDHVTIFHWRKYQIRNTVRGIAGKCHMIPGTQVHDTHLLILADRDRYSQSQAVFASYPAPHLYQNKKFLL